MPWTHGASSSSSSIRWMSSITPLSNIIHRRRHHHAALYVRRIYVHTHNHRLLDARRCAIAVARPLFHESGYCRSDWTDRAAGNCCSLKSTVSYIPVRDILIFFRIPSFTSVFIFVPSCCALTCVERFHIFEKKIISKNDGIGPRIRLNLRHFILRKMPNVKTFFTRQ